MSARWQPAFGPRLHRIEGAGHRAPGIGHRIEGTRPRAPGTAETTGATFRVCAPDAASVSVVMSTGDVHQMTRREGDVFEAHVIGARAGDRYMLGRDETHTWPDPCSHWQPDGVHGPSMLVDPDAFAWTDASWTGVARPRLAIYELHVGTFTSEGTFAAATAKLPELAALGVTAIELMPIAAFPGTRNWGYDGGALFAPSERYGHPDDLRRLVDRAHALGLAVLLDVVYNHLGPDGAYLAAWMPTIFHSSTSPWGRAINLDGPGSTDVRRLLCDNALHWLIEYHMDGLRLDATHALVDTSPEHLLAQLAREVAACISDREVHLIAEDERNLNTLLHPVSRGGAGMTGVWTDDFHHAVRRHLAGDRDAWFADFTGDIGEIATAVRDGWVFTGQYASHFGGARGTPPHDVPIEAAVICLQDHDQIGNRAFGDRLHHGIDIAAWLAASALLLTAPETPLLFMGQEWAASTPFLYFTDHEPGLGRQVIDGRRREFRRFAAFASDLASARIPSPQDIATWRASVLDWTEPAKPIHAHVLAETTALLGIRAAHLSMPRDRTSIRCDVVGPRALCLAQPSACGGHLVTIVDFSDTPARFVPWPRNVAGREVRLLHATASTAAPRATSVSVEGDAIAIDAPSAPYAVVLHTAGVSS
ncbi:MAG: malto-oligosyltrehalose trehalohydrolase [Acidobacteria bacterium]|nr:malto-oligosyltrehalose trehalohydrolase [Acidobacteriota bacterium]